MPAKVERGLKIPILDEFLYSVLYQASFAEKRGLKGKYMRAAFNERECHRFVNNSSREEKEYILSHLGYEFCYIIYKKSFSFPKIREIYEKLGSNRKLLGLKCMVEEGLYVHSDKEFQRYLGIMAQHIHHPTFFMNHEILRQGHHLKNWSKKLKSETNLQMREVDETMRYIAKFLFDAMLMLDNMKSILAVGQNELKMLLYLYASNKVDICADEIKSVFAGFIRPMALPKHLLALKKGNYISCIDKGDHKAYYSITSLGIRVVNNYFNHLHNQNNF